MAKSLVATSSPNNQNVFYFRSDLSSYKFGDAFKCNRYHVGHDLLGNGGDVVAVFPLGGT